MLRINKKKRKKRKKKEKKMNTLIYILAFLLILVVLIIVFFKNKKQKITTTTTTKKINISTTTSSLGLLYIENLSKVSDITNIRVNGTQVTLEKPYTFPIKPNQVVNATTPYVGIYDVFVEMESYDSDSSMIVDTSSSTCFNVTSTGTVGHKFIGSKINSSIAINIIIQDNSC